MRKAVYQTRQAFNKGYLKVSDIHEIYYEEVGNPKGKPILYLHGGPGANIDEESSRFFDPDFYRVILFDQRGAGKSRPSQELKENDTFSLVEDIEKLRNHLGIDKWILFGTSWGATLALIYAINHTNRVKGMVIKGIFLAREEDFEWSFIKGASDYYPQEFEDFISILTEDEKKDIIGAYYKRLLNDKTAEEAAIKWNTWESTNLFLNYNPKGIEDYIRENLDFAIKISKIESHYFANKCFLEEDNYILKNANKLSGLPVSILHGRFDLVCKPEAAYSLHKLVGGSSLKIVQNSGHSNSEGDMEACLVEAVERAKEW